MCGIVGIIQQRGAPVTETLVRGCVAELAHRGPDGVAVLTEGALGLGHRRLAIFDLGERGAQPMWRDDCAIVFNGAIYNFPELRETLREKGHVFRTDTDTEVILAAYQSWGTACVEYFNGMWAFAIYDRQKQLLFCSRDRYGIKPFYYTTFAGGFAFASEIKAFQRLPGWSARLNPLRAYEWLAHGWQDHTPETLFADVYQLPPATNLLYRLQDHQWRLESYYSPAAVAPLRTSDLTLEEAISGLRERLSQSIRLRRRADVPLALTLSGGIDSSAIAGLWRRDAGPEVELTAFSAFFPNTSIDEGPFIEAVSRRHHVRVRPFQTDWPEVRASLDQVIRQQDEPIGSAAVVVHYLLLQQAAAECFKVLLNGQGADEVLAGYDKFYAPHFRRLMQEEPLRLPAELYYFQQLHHWNWQVVAKRLRHFLQPPATVPFVAHCLHPHHPSLIFQRGADGDSLRRCSINLLREIGLPVLLHYEDRNAMAHGLEMRVPFLDHQLVDYALRLPDAYKIRRARRKYLLREAVRDLLPDPIYRRYDKLGFPTPQWRWIVSDSQFFIQQATLAAKDYPTVFGPATGAWVEGRTKHPSPTDLGAVWRVISFYRWLKIFQVRV